MAILDSNPYNNIGRSEKRGGLSAAEGALYHKPSLDMMEAAAPETGELLASDSLLRLGGVNIFCGALGSPQSKSSFLEAAKKKQASSEWPVFVLHGESFLKELDAFIQTVSGERLRSLLNLKESSFDVVAYPFKING